MEETDYSSSGSVTPTVFDDYEYDEDDPDRAPRVPLYEIDEDFERELAATLQASGNAQFTPLNAHLRVMVPSLGFKKQCFGLQIHLKFI